MIVFKDVWDELETAILTAWPDVKDGYSAVQSARLNWRDALAAGAIEPPFAVIRPLRAEPYDELTVFHALAATVEITYVRSATQTEAERSAGTTVAAAIDAKLVALSESLEHGSFLTFQLIDECALDSSDLCEANQAFLATGAPYLAGTVTAVLIVSERTETI